VKFSLAVAFLLSVLCAGLCWGQDKCNSDTDGVCCDCSVPMVGNCIKRAGGNGCKCMCYSLIFYCTSSGMCTNGHCAQVATRVTPETIARTPWATSPKIVEQLAEHSVLPSPDVIYDQVMIAELKAGRVGHHGVVIDPQLQRKYREWWNLNDNSLPNEAHLTIWLDENGVWKFASDVDESKVRLPITETVDLFEDHWEQTNSKGRFSGNVEPYTTSVRTPFRITPQTLAQTPWVTTPGIVDQLAEHSVMSSPAILYDLVITAELKAGPTGHSGSVGDPERKANYVQWWNLDDDIAKHHSHLTLWLDENGVWQSTADIHESKTRLPITETVDLFEDHWEQVNAKGRFSGKVKPF
jgi:hypothetical protein